MLEIFVGSDSVAADMFPYLAPDFEVKWKSLTPEGIVPAIRHALERARTKIEQISTQPAGEASYESTFLAFEDATEELGRGWGRLKHLDSVADSPEQREALDELLPEVTDFYSSLVLNPRLWNVVKTAAADLQEQDLTDIQRRHVEEVVMDFKNSGADLPDDRKTRIAEIDSALSLKTKAYAEHVLDSTNAWENGHRR